MSDPNTESSAWAAQNKGPWIVITCWVVTAVSTVFVVSRLYVRGWLMRKLQQDDWWTVIAMICGYISTALSTRAVSYGNGQHMKLLSKEQQEGAVLWTTAAFCPGVMSFGLPKLAVVYLLTKLLNPGRWHKAFLWWMGIWCQLTLFATCGVLLGRCRPARSLWNFDIPGECFSPDILVAYCIYAGAFSAFVDLYLAIYPAVVLFRLQMSLKKKLALSVALGIGSVSGVVAIYKTTRIPALKSDDFSYDTADLVAWTVIEGSTIIIASSIPILQPLLEKILRRNPFSSGGKSSTYNARYYEDYSDQKSGYELGQRKPKSKTRDDLGMTVMEEGGSEEEILKANAVKANGQSASAAFVATGAGSSTTTQSRGSPPLKGITRTDVVTVSYAGATPPHVPGSSDPSTWRP